MRGHDQPSDRRRLRAGAWLVLFFSAASAQAQAQDPPAEGTTALALAESISLTADKVRYWDADGRHCALLEGHAAALQGADGLRAERAVVRFGPADGSAATRVEVYAEAARRTDGDGRVENKVRIALATERQVDLNTYAGSGPVRLTGPPAGVALLGRAFPEPEPRPAAESPAPTRPEAPPPPDQVIPAERPEAVQAPPEPAPMADPSVRPTQFVGDDPPEEPEVIQAPPDDVPADAAAPGPEVMVEEGAPVALPDEDLAPPTDVVPLPPSDLPPSPPPPSREERANPAVVVPYTARSYSIAPRDYKFTIEHMQASDGTPIILIRGGVNVRAQDPKNGIVDVSADNAVIWLEKRDGGLIGEAQAKQNANDRFEIYLDGNVVLRQDKRQVAGNGDVSIMKADKLYMDFRTERKIGQNAEMMFYAPGLLAPVRTTGTEINQYTPQYLDEKGRLVSGPTQIRADNTQTTGSRFPKPGYLFSSQSLDIFQRIDALTEPNTGRPVGNPRDPNAPKDRIWTIDSRQNFYYIGPVPVFYWPRIVADSDDLDPPLRNIRYAYGNYFGHQVYLSWNGFKALNIRKPTFIDNWNIDTDILSIRGPALGSELGWFGNDLIGDLIDPYHKDKSRAKVDRPYFGYFDIWGILDHGDDVLGSGPAIVTYGPPGFGKFGDNGFPFQRSKVPPSAFNQMLRGRVTFRHMQFLLPSDAPEDEDMRLQVEVGYLSDRHFLEEYYKRLFDSGLDQETLAYYIWQRENRAFTVHTEVNLNNWNTETQWFPKLQYYRLGDSLFGDIFTYFQDSGFDYASTHTAVEVNNPNIFAFIPYDPVSNTFNQLNTARAWTTHELDMPINLGILRVVPYGQGQLVGWNNQLGGTMVGRAWGAGGARANAMAWRAFPDVDSELFNVHGLAHKINFNVDYRAAFSNVPLNRIGVQDDLDDNTYEFTRRYFALTNYVGGLLPPQYDPRFLTLRRAISPIAGTTDIQSTIQSLQLDLNQRLQTKRGPEGKRRVVDWMVLDLKTTYFPYASRDNFGKPFGQNMYNYEWYIGDRTSIISTGWFEFWNIQGNPVLVNNPRHNNDPFGLAAVNTGIQLSRPPRGTIYLGYSVINTGPIATSAIISSFSYWLSPKWYSTYTTTYDFGNAILLGSTVSLTRIGADFLTSIGLTVDPQRNNYTFAFELVPRFSPNVRFGAAPMAQRFDTRFAPTQ